MLIVSAFFWCFYWYAFLSNLDELFLSHINEIEGILFFGVGGLFVFILGPYGTLVEYSYKILISKDRVIVSKYFGLVKKNYSYDEFEKAKFLVKNRVKVTIIFHDSFSIKVNSLASNFLYLDKFIEEQKGQSKNK
jgi:hypothetical protein